MMTMKDLKHGTFTCPGLASGNAAAAKKFYTSLLGWEAKDETSPEGTFTMFTIGGDMVAGMYQGASDRIKAGVMPHWNSYVVVKGIDAMVKKCKDLGGTVKLGPFDAGEDKMANLQDPLGASFSIMESHSQSMNVRLSDVGALVWSELYTTDTDRAGQFYAKLFDWELQPFKESPMPYTVFKPKVAERGIGGMLKITDDMKGMKPQWMPYFHVTDADQFSAKSKDLGAQIHGPFDVPTVGRIAIIMDPEKAGFAVIHPKPM